MISRVAFETRRSSSNLLAIVGSLALHGVVFGAIASAAGPAQSSAEPTPGRWAGDLFMISTESPTFVGLGAEGGEKEPPRGEQIAGAIEEPEPPRVEDVPVPSPNQAVTKVAKVSVEAGTKPAPPPRIDSRDRSERTPKIPSKTSSNDKAVSNTNVGTGGTDGPRDGEKSESGGGTFGSEGAILERGRFPDAFTRVLPVAAQGLRGIYEAEFGSLGRFLVRVTIDEEGKLVSLAPLKTPPPVFISLLKSAQILLRAGRFALPSGSRGEFLVGLAVTVGEEASEAGDGDLAPASAVRGLSHTRPSGKEPGIALVRYASGKKITLLVDPEPNPKAY